MGAPGEKPSCQLSQTTDCIGPHILVFLPPSMTIDQALMVRAQDGEQLLTQSMVELFTLPADCTLVALTTTRIPKPAGYVAEVTLR
jgi:hypothetical protein